MQKLIRILGTILLIALIAAGVYYYQTGGPKAPEFVRLENVRLKNLSSLPKISLEFSADALLKNSNPFAVYIDDLKFDVWVDGMQTTAVEQTVGQEMPAEAVSKLPINFEIPLSDKNFFKNIRSILEGAWKNKELNIRTVGTIEVKVANVLIEVPFDEENSYLIADYLTKD